LRRSVATYMADDLKIAPVVVDRILNHVTGSLRGVAAVYQRSEFLADRKVALETWGQFVEKLFTVNK